MPEICISTNFPADVATSFGPQGRTAPWSVPRGLQLHLAYSAKTLADFPGGGTSAAGPLASEYFRVLRGAAEVQASPWWPGQGRGLRGRGKQGGPPRSELSPAGRCAAATPQARQGRVGPALGHVSLLVLQARPREAPGLEVAFSPRCRRPSPHCRAQTAGGRYPGRDNRPRARRFQGRVGALRPGLGAGSRPAEPGAWRGEWAGPAEVGRAGAGLQRDALWARWAGLSGRARPRFLTRRFPGLCFPFFLLRKQRCGGGRCPGLTKAACQPLTPGLALRHLQL